LAVDSPPAFEDGEKPEMNKLIIEPEEDGEDGDEEEKEEQEEKAEEPVLRNASLSMA
jgi:hypothetical protein|tara:strand:+ start:385 stop:555 length:171 start_codon:yes stop_codon:yes gene_type:complete